MQHTVVFYKYTNTLHIRMILGEQKKNGRILWYNARIMYVIAFAFSRSTRKDKINRIFVFHTNIKSIFKCMCVCVATDRMLILLDSRTKIVREKPPRTANYFKLIWI